LLLYHVTNLRALIGDDAAFAWQASGSGTVDLQALDAPLPRTSPRPGLPSRAPLAFSRQRLLGANRDHRPLLLGERGIDGARGSTIRCLGIEVVAASYNSSRQTLARKG
jgi:hypothetical protein